MPQCVEMVGPDQRMDHENFGPSLNPLPAKCSHCKMPDLDHVPQPYLLGRGTTSPADMAPADAGNLLVRESAKRVLETVAPGDCHFYPTVHSKTREPTPWFLAVPREPRRSTGRRPALPHMRRALVISSQFTAQPRRPIRRFQIPKLVRLRRSVYGLGPKTSESSEPNPLLLSSVGEAIQKVAYARPGADV